MPTDTPTTARAPGVTLSSVLPGPGMEKLVREAEARFNAMSPVDQAMHDAEQRRSMVRGLCGRDPGPDVLVEEIKRLRALAHPPAAEREAPAYAPIPEDEEDRNRLLEAVVYAEGGPHTLAHVAAKLRWPLIATVEAVGKHYWMMLTGDLTNPETTKVEGDGE